MTWQKAFKYLVLYELYLDIDRDNNAETNFFQWKDLIKVLNIADVRVERATLHVHLSYFLRPWKRSNLSVQKRQKVT